MKKAMNKTFNSISKPGNTNDTKEKRKVLAVFLAAIALALTVAPVHALELSGRNPAGTTIDTPFGGSDSNPSAVTSSVNTAFINDGTVVFWGSIDNNGVINNNGTLTDLSQSVCHNNNAGAVWNNNAGANMDIGNGWLNNAAGAVFNNYGTFQPLYGGYVDNSGTITNHAGGMFYNPTVTDNHNIFMNNGTYDGWIFYNRGGVVTNNSTWLNHSGVLWNYAGAAFHNNGTMIFDSPHVKLGYGLYNEGIFYNNQGGVISSKTLVVWDNHSGGTINNAGVITNEWLIRNHAGGLFNNAGTLTNYTGAVIDNAGAFNNLAGGTLTNAGTINNTGTATLAAGSGYDFTGGTFNNNAGGTLALNRDFTFGGTGGTVNLNAGGTLENNAVLTNPAGYTQINNGTLNNNPTGVFINNGTFNTATVFANSGLFMGTGTTNGNVVNNGTIAPGNSIGTMTINGNYTHNAGAVYRVETNPGMQSDLLVVSGTATLNGGTVSVMAGSGTYMVNTNYRYEILRAGSVLGTFGGVTSDLAFLTPSLDYKPGSVWLSLLRNSTNFCDVAGSSNQASVACTLDQTHTTPDMVYVMNALLGLNAEGARHAYDRMSGLIHIDMMEATSYALNRYASTLSGRMEGFSMPGSSFARAGNLLLASRDDAGSDVGNILVAAVNSVKGEGANGSVKEASPWGLWAKGYGNIGNRNGNDISSRYDYRGGGLVVGFDRKISDSLLVGIAGGSSYTKVSMNELAEHGSVSGYQGSIYGAYNAGRLYINALAAYGYNRYDTTRDISFGYINRTASAQYDGHVLNGYIEAGYRLPVSSFNIVPMASIQAGSLWRNHFTEENAGALNLGVDREYATSITSSLGVKVNREFKAGKSTITPELRLRWLHEFADNDYSITNVFASDPVSGFTVKGDGAGRDSIVAGLGLTVDIGRDLGLALSYDATIAGGRIDHGGMLGVVYRW